MKQEKLTEIVCIIDRSGSMGPIRDNATGSFNTFLKDQQSLSGEENASTEFNLPQIESMIKEQIEQDQWNFVYLSADPKAFLDAGKIDIARNNVVRFEADIEGIQDYCMKMNRVCCSIRAGGVSRYGKKK